MRCASSYLATLMGMLHIGIILIHNLCHLSAAGSSLELVHHKTLRSLCDMHILRYYAQITGTHGGYGFYSPEVGSSYHSQFTVQDYQSGVVHTLSDPGLATTASKIRYSSLLDVPHGWLDSMINKQPKQLAEALAITLTKATASRYPKAAVQSRFTVFRVPRLSDLNQDPSLSSKHHLLLEK